MTAYTTPDGLPYPDDYQQPADSPAAIQALANGTQTALNNHADKATQITAGSGLVGGGDLSANRTLNVGQGTGIAVSADAVALDTGFTDGRYSGAGHLHDSRYSQSGHGHDAASIGAAYAGHGHDPGAIGAAYSGHGHNPSGVGIRIGSYQFSSIAAGVEAVSPVLGKYGDEYIFLQKAHPSTYLITSLDNITAGGFQIKCRNSTTSTTHTAITVWYLLVRGA